LVAFLRVYFNAQTPPQRPNLEIPKLFMQGRIFFLEYLHIPTNTIKYMHIHAYTCTNASNTCIYLRIA
jgi:hypothetical protein